MAGIAISLALAAFFGFCIYWIRLWVIRDPIQMRRFLNRRYEVIRRKGFWGEERPHIDEAMIKRWGYAGWGLMPLPAFNLSMDLTDLWSLGGVSSIALLFFAGMLFGDARAGVHFLRELGVVHYEKQAEQG
jgi:hypothetical protein